MRSIAADTQFSRLLLRNVWNDDKLWLYFATDIYSVCVCKISKDLQVKTSATEYRSSSLLFLQTKNHNPPLKRPKIFHLSSMLVICHERSWLYGVLEKSTGIAKVAIDRYLTAQVLTMLKIYVERSPWTRSAVKRGKIHMIAAARAPSRKSTDIVKKVPMYLSAALVRFFDDPLLFY